VLQYECPLKTKKEYDMGERDREMIVKMLVEFFEERGMNIVDIENILERVIEKIYERNREKEK